MVSFLISEIGNMVSVLNMFDGLDFCTFILEVKSNAMNDYLGIKELCRHFGKDVEKETHDES